MAVSRSGTALCPWHSDRHPSLKLYEGDRGCWCFACQRGGDVVELVAGILGVSRVQAAQQISRDFGLRLAFGRDKETPEGRRERAERRAELERYKAFLRWLDEAQTMLCAVHRLGWLARSTPPEDLPEDVAVAVRDLPVVEYYLDVLAAGNTGDIQQIRKGVEELCSLRSKTGIEQNRRAS